ncbi:hypothetical protein TanjilG_07568 [Lupinus angustifolius]|uniref:Serine aminopeptidase S33 domain-containing protein n=1 Tax=Lupinus angustifolius TaxID=3871 RepID=A0A1J7G5U5_LUPAN|nr:hypothetical protein TanjilG_07568 [Lupinus angustifolius]
MDVSSGILRMPEIAHHREDVELVKLATKKGNTIVAVYDYSGYGQSSGKNIDKIPLVKCPVLVIHGTDDEVVNISHGKTLWELCNEKYEPLWLNGGNHCNLELFPQYLGHLRKFISATTKKQPQPPMQNRATLKTKSLNISSSSIDQKEKSRSNIDLIEKPRSSTGSREKSRTSTDKRERSRRSLDHTRKPRNTTDQMEKARISFERWFIFLSFSFSLCFLPFFYLKMVCTILLGTLHIRVSCHI